MLEADLYVSGKPVADDNPLADEDQQIAEIVIVDGSPLDRQTLNSTNFAGLYDLTPLAIHRAGSAIDSMPQGIGNVVFRSGDILLVQGAREQLATLKREGSMFILDATVRSAI